MDRLYVVYDKTAEQSSPPFMAVNDGIAVRQFRHLMKDVPDSQDYTLSVIAEYDTKTMQLELIPAELIDTGEVK